MGETTGQERVSGIKSKGVCPLRRGDCLGELCAWYIAEAKICAIWALGRVKAAQMAW